MPYYIPVLLQSTVLFIYATLSGLRECQLTVTCSINLNDRKCGGGGDDIIIIIIIIIIITTTTTTTIIITTARTTTTTTTPCSRVPLEKLTVTQLVKKSPAFY